MKNFLGIMKMSKAHLMKSDVTTSNSKRHKSGARMSPQLQEYSSGHQSPFIYNKYIMAKVKSHDFSRQNNL